jgi:2-dehydro-3-deoxyphosphogluconate aldolase/(4S)-4-hydroxy-2-oxoglutarate aldolase
MSLTPPDAAPADDPIETLGAIGVIPVVVIDNAASAAPLAEALLAGGIRAAEITLRTPAAMAALEIMAGYSGFLAGAGTLLDPGQAASAADAGARFAVSPGFDPRVVDACQACSLPVMPGAVTATEVQQVRRAGLTVCKFFPAESAGGLPMLAALSAPFQEMLFMPTGGIGPANAGNYLRAPFVHAIGGTWMAARALIAGCEWDRIRDLAAEAAIAAAEARQAIR